MYKVTFSMPVYNAECLIERSLLSALNQSFENIEYIIVDDKGQDDSMDIVRRVIAEHPRGKHVRIIDHVENQGVGATRNTAMDSASSPYIFFMDDDDELTLDCIETLYTKMMERPVDFVASSFVRRYDDGTVMPGCIYNDRLIAGEHCPVGRYRYGEQNAIHLPTWNKLYDLHFLRSNNIRFKPKHLTDDPWFTYQLILNAKSCRLLPEVTYFYSINPKSVTCKNKDGYSELAGHQYEEIQQLKCDYIPRFRQCWIYPNLVYDIMFMSLYHSYRVLESGKIVSKRRVEISRKLLSYRFAWPQKFRYNHHMAKFLMLYGVYNLPLLVKITSIRLVVAMNVRKILGRWIHF